MRFTCVILLTIFASCANEVKQTTSAKDTTRVIELALRTVMTEKFPEMDGIKRKSIFNDSIFLTTNLFALSALPAGVDSFHFKVLPDSSICSLIKTDTINEELPNYLKLQSFEKTDSGYFVQFESMDCIPAPSRDGSVSLHILKTADKYVFKNK